MKTLKFGVFCGANPSGEEAPKKPPYKIHMKRNEQLGRKKKKCTAVKPQRINDIVI